MNLHKNYYLILNVSNIATEKEIKTSYRKLSFKHHPDKDGDANIFAEITEAYDVLCGDNREEYDKKSKFGGSSYNEYYELFEVDFNFSHDDSKNRLEKFKRDEVLDIHIKVDDKFNGSVVYERWVRCKPCDGSGKDLTSKIIIRDNDGNVLKIFESDDGCDFCEGTGKDYRGGSCGFCLGQGKVGLNPCKTCNGDKRILGKQKLSKIKLTGNETKIDAMGHCSKTEVGKFGYLLLIKE